MAMITKLLLSTSLMSVTSQLLRRTQEYDMQKNWKAWWGPPSTIGIFAKKLKAVNGVQDSDGEDEVTIWMTGADHNKKLCQITSRVDGVKANKMIDLPEFGISAAEGQAIALSIEEHDTMNNDKSNIVRFLPEWQLGVQDFLKSEEAKKNNITGFSMDIKFLLKDDFSSLVADLEIGNLVCISPLDLATGGKAKIVKTAFTAFALVNENAKKTLDTISFCLDEAAKMFETKTYYELMLEVRSISDDKKEICTFNTGNSPEVNILAAGAHERQVALFGLLAFSWIVGWVYSF
jgi:hypothetical protein